MSKVRIITDSNSGITQEEANKLGITLIPMPFTIDGEEYFEGINITQDEFHQKLKDGADVKTSQPSQVYISEVWDDVLKTYDEIIHIPMTSGLSASCDSAKTLAKDYDGRVHVIDNLRISVTQKASVYEALELANQGKSAQEIEDYLMATKDKASIYIMVNELKYLKKGGRISPAAATLGSMLKVKPVLTTRGGKFEKYVLALSLGIAKVKMIDKIYSELNTEFKEEYEAGKMIVSVAHTQNDLEALKFKEEILKKIPNIKFAFVDPLSLSVSCHIGSGALAIAICINNYAKI